MRESMPVISVLLPVYNGELYLAESIDSILNQTWTDFELIIINDGSQDGSSDIIKGYVDQRIRYYEHENIGLAATLNRGIDLSAGTFIARQDHDDLSKPERLAKQVDYLEAHPECALLGTWADIWKDDQASGRFLQHPTDSALINLELLLTNPFVHSSVMMRKECLQNVGGYAVDPSRQPPEDYELWSRLARRHEVANIPESLVIYREVVGSISRSTDRQFWERVVTICQENIQSVLGCNYNPKLVRGAARLFHGVYDPSDRTRTKELIALMSDLGRVLETRYPDHRKQLRAQLKKYFHVMLNCLYARYTCATLAKYLVQIRSLWLFR
jgi:glycosyltransferase involved in cell wall biosynthesis